MRDSDYRLAEALARDEYEADQRDRAEGCARCHGSGVACDLPADHDGGCVLAPCECCQTCHGTGIIIVAGPDENGLYDADDCPCQT